MERKYLKPSDFYFGIGCLLTVLCFNIYYSSGGLIRYWIFAFIIFIVTLIISHNKKIRNSFDYKLNNGAKK